MDRDVTSVARFVTNVCRKAHAHVHDPAHAARPEQRYPGLKFAGTAESRFGTIGPGAQEEIAAQIRASGAQFVFVGLGCPRQEIFTWAMAGQVSLPMQRCGLQWLHRLAGDPRRLWRRYLLLNPEYVWRVVRQRIGREPRVASGEPHADTVPA
jgi:UDP-N-acetyl-D-mannosaminuronic acid transferase (WecB/TagA/CpsF family)